MRNANQINTKCMRIDKEIEGLLGEVKQLTAAGFGSQRNVKMTGIHMADILAGRIGFVTDAFCVTGNL